MAKGRIFGQVTNRAAMFLLTLTLGGCGGGAAVSPASTPQTTQAAQQPTVPAEFFGLHVHKAASSTPWPVVPFGTWRLWDAKVNWLYLEPNKGQWDFDLLDRYVDLAERNNVDVLFVLASTPSWASARPNEPADYCTGCAAEPADIQDWRDYVTTVATRYKGRIRNYEVWNEPNLKEFYTGDMQHMVQLQQEAYRILKQVDASNVVVSPSAVGSVNGVQWLDQFLQQGGGAFADVIGFHFYVTPNPPEAMVPVIQKVRGIMFSYGIEGKPLWNTESGWLIANHDTTVQPIPGDPSFSVVLSDDQASAYVARSYVLNWTDGVSRFLWYSWDHPRMGLTEADGVTLKPPATAYAAIERWLVGAVVSPSTQDASGTWSCAVQRNQKSGWIVWNPAGSTTFAIPVTAGPLYSHGLNGDTTAVTGGTASVGSSPVLIDGEP